MSLINDEWFLNKGLELKELEERTIIIFNLLSRKNNPKVKKYFSLFNFYNGRQPINTLMECLDLVMKKEIKQQIICNINANYIFLTTNLSPYYKKKDYPILLKNKHPYENEMKYIKEEERIFIKCFIDDFTRILDEIIQSCLLERCGSYLYIKTSNKIEKFREKLILLELKLPYL